MLVALEVQLEKKAMKIKALILSLIAMGFTAPSFAQSDVDTLREQLRALQLRLDQIERDNASKAQQPAAAPAAAAVTQIGRAHV